MTEEEGDEEVDPRERGRAEVREGYSSARRTSRVV